MKQYVRLVKLLFVNLFKFDKTKKSGANIAMVIALATLYLIIEAGLVIGAVYLAPRFEALGILNELIALMFAMAAIIVAVFGIVSMLSFLYFSRDTEFFLSLPLSPGAVFSAKFTVIYLTELVLSAALLIPMLIVLGFVTTVPLTFYPIILLGVLLAPSIPLILAALVAIPLMYVIGFFKNKGALTSIVVLLLFGGIFAIYYTVLLRFQFSEDETVDPLIMLEALRGMFVSIANAVYPYLALARLSTLSPAFGLGAAGSFFVNLLLSFGVIAALIALSVFISGFVYARGAAAQLESPKHKATGKEKYEQSSILKALVKKEWKNIIRTPSFAYQCLMVVILSPLMMFVLGFSISGAVEEAGEIMKIPGISWVTFMGIMSLFIGLNITPATAFTREGKSFYMLKTLPIDAKIQIRAKNLLSFFISAAGILLGSIVVLIADPNPLLWLLSIMILSLYAYGFNSAALLFDLKKPKLDWTTPHEAMKSNFNAAAPSLMNMAASSLLIGGGVSIYMYHPNTWGVAAVYALFAIVSTVLIGIFPQMLNKKAHEFFERIE